MPGMNKDRNRSQTIAFRVSVEEEALINEKIKLSGASKGDYLRDVVLGKKITVDVGKFESDRLSIEFKRLREEMERLDFMNLQSSVENLKTEMEDIYSSLVAMSALMGAYAEARALMQQMKPLMELHDKRQGKKNEG